jgi:anthranilate synthase component 1
VTSQIAFCWNQVEGGEVRGRFSVIGLAPDLIWRCRDGALKSTSHQSMMLASRRSH